MADWQQIVSLLIVAAASLWLVRQIKATLQKVFRSKPGDQIGCGSCAKNPMNQNETKLVSLTPMRKTDKS